MNVKVSIKQIGKKRNKINAVDFYIENNPDDVKMLITEAVRTCVSEYNKRVQNGENALPITNDEINDMSEIGKIAFGINYGKKCADMEKAVETALQAYEDGIFRIFINDIEVGAISEKISLSENDTLTFVRLVMLAGRMW